MLGYKISELNPWVGTPPANATYPALISGYNWQVSGISSGGGATAASGVSFTPSGNIAATNVQTAIQELDTEKLATSLLPTGSNFIYVSKDTNATDTRTGLSKYNLFRPFSTISAALSAASSPDTIVILPGTYSASNLSLKNGVNIYCYPGVVIESGTTGSGSMFQTSGTSIAASITGYGTFNLNDTSGNRFLFTSSHASCDITIEGLDFNTSGNSSNKLFYVSSAVDSRYVFKGRKIYGLVTGGILSESASSTSTIIVVDFEEVYINSSSNVVAFLMQGSATTSIKVKSVYFGTSSGGVFVYITGGWPVTLEFEHFRLESSARLVENIVNTAIVNGGELYHNSNEYAFITENSGINIVNIKKVVLYTEGLAYIRSGEIRITCENFISTISGAPAAFVDQQGQYAAPAMVSLSGSYQMAGGGAVIEADGWEPVIVLRNFVGFSADNLIAEAVITQPTKLQAFGAWANVNALGSVEEVGTVVINNDIYV